MVQKKAPDRYGSPAEPKGGHAKPERRLYSNQNQHHHQDGGGGGGLLRKMLNKSRSIKVLEESLDSPLGTQLVQLGNPPALKRKKKKKKKRPSPAGLPNYMKSTSSSNAKKEQAQVSSTTTPPPVAAGNRVRSPKSSPTPSDHLKKKGPSPGGTPGVMPGMLLARKSSLRAVRPPTKMVLGTPLCPPQINANRATCSSTMKETTFPDHLDLNPGATEAEGTSLFKVCPYTYCSLNGHRHAPLPPLKCFLSARRRLLKTQKSMKLRGLPSFRKTQPKEEETEIGAELGVSSSSLVEDPGDDFFVEIYAKCPAEPSAPVGGDDDANTVAVRGTASAGDGEEDWDARIEEDGSSPTGDSRSQISSDDVFDQISEFSPSEMEVLINFLEFVECDSEDECCFPADSDEFGGELAEEEGACEPIAEAADLDWEEDDPGLYIDFDEIEYSEIAEDESYDGTIFALPNEGCEEAAEDIVAEDEGRTGSDETVEATTSTLEDTIGEKNKDELEKPFEEQRAEAVGPETGDLIAVSNKESTAADPCDEAPDTEDLFGIDKLFSHANNTHTFDTEEKQGKVGKDQNDEASIIEMETWESEVEEDESPVSEKDPVESDDKLDAPSELSTDTSTTEFPRAAAAITRAATSSAEEEGTDAWAMVIRKKAHGDAEEEQLRAFNPRDPNFLPVEPDPEAEKVDLRHQMMDERKNSEEWMVDYALRQAVDKLAPGRKRKVALLVEAFETVAPVPAYGSSLSHSTVEFAHARPIQACS